MCLYILACIGLANVVLFSLFAVTAVVLLLLTFLLLASAPYWVPGPVVDPAPSSSCLVVPVGPTSCLDVDALAAVVLVEHALILTLLFAVYGRLIRRPGSPAVVHHVHTSYGAVDV